MTIMQTMTPSTRFCRKTNMLIDTYVKHSFASSLTYAPQYLERCATALQRALCVTPAYEAWRPFDPGLSYDVFTRFAALPALTKRDLRAHGPQAFVPKGLDLAQGLAEGELELVQTSGTTGDQVTNVWYQPWWDASEMASFQLNANARRVITGAHREAILTSPWCTGFPCEDGYLTMAERSLGRFLYLSERSDPSTWSSALMDRMVAELNAFKPVTLEANPSFLARLARHIVSNRLRVYSPGIIILTYEYPSVLHYRQIRKAFDASIASSYGSTEAGYVFMECEAGRMHQVAESCHVDFLPFAPEHGGPDVGRILVTSFDNPWRSLLRFDVGDIVRLDQSALCPCGRHDGLTLAAIEGRVVNLTSTPDGHVVTQGTVDRALGGVEGLAQYQFLQTGPMSYTLRCVVEGAAPHHVLGEAREALQTIYGSAATIATESVRALTPDPPGKYRLAKSLVPFVPETLLDSEYAPREF
jgi:phenylacetate-coenzyme A ligase PaaK-like adenylate-forming protein